MKHLWLVLALVGCGDDSSMEPPVDAVGEDADVDAGPECSGAAEVSVVGPSFDPEERQLTFTLVSHDANGRMCSMKDAGNAPESTTMIDVPPTGMVTMVLEDGEGERRLYTWTEVQPGDLLRFPTPIPLGVTQQMVAVELTIPAMTGVTNYDVYVQCEHGGGGLSDTAPAGAFTKMVECPSNATKLAAMIQARDNDTTHYALSTVTPILPSGPTTLTVGAYAPAASPVVTLHGTAGFDRAYAGFSPGATADFHSVTMLSFANMVTDPVTVGPRNVPATWPLGVTAAISKPAEPTHTLQIARRLTAPGPVALDVTADFPPLLSAQLGAGLPRPSITWSTERVASADAVYVNAGNWLMATRAQPGTVRFPEVPQALLPDGPAKVQAVVLIDAASINGFEEVRRDPGGPYLDREASISSIGDAINGIVP